MYDSILCILSNELELELQLETMRHEGIGVI
jgi:hypothetical protein